jgi:ubiquinone/menaquinone biosynthesis C-methylase UbiE
MGDVGYYSDGQVVAEYEGARFGGVGDAVIQRLQIAALRRAFCLVQPVARLLDAGCGTGRLLGALPWRSAVGLDASEVMLKVSAQRNPMAVHVQGDMRALPFSDNQFDVAVSVWVLNHIPEYWTAVDELARVSKYVILALPASQSLYAFRGMIDRLGFARWFRRGYIPGKTPPLSFNISPVAFEKELVRRGYKVWWSERSLLLPIVPGWLAGFYRKWEQRRPWLSKVFGGFYVVGFSYGTSVQSRTP